MKLRKSEMKLRKNEIKVPKNISFPPWTIQDLHRGIPNSSVEPLDYLPFTKVLPRYFID